MPLQTSEPPPGEPPPAALTLALAPAAAPAPVGDLGAPLPPLTLLRVIGRGKFSTVHLAALGGAAGPRVAVKRVALDGGARETALREVALLRALGSHPHIVRLLYAGIEREGECEGGGAATAEHGGGGSGDGDAGAAAAAAASAALCGGGNALLPSAAGAHDERTAASTWAPSSATDPSSASGAETLVLVCELADAGDLKRALRRMRERGARLAESAVWRLFAQLAEGVAHMHRCRVLHRDLKPANVFLTSRGCAKIGDLGLGRLLPLGELLEARSRVGTPLYMAPEVLRGEPQGAPADAWGLGCMLYELAALVSPFKERGGTLQTLFERVAVARYAPLGEGWSRGLRELVTRLLNADPAARAGVDEACDTAQCMAKAAEQAAEASAPAGLVAAVSPDDSREDALPRIVPPARARVPLLPRPASAAPAGMASQAAAPSRGPPVRARSAQFHSTLLHAAAEVQLPPRGGGSACDDHGGATPEGGSAMGTSPLSASSHSPVATMASSATFDSGGAAHEDAREQSAPRCGGCAGARASACSLGEGRGERCSVGAPDMVRAPYIFPSLKPPPLPLPIIVAMMRGGGQPLHASRPPSSGGSGGGRGGGPLPASLLSSAPVLPAHAPAIAPTTATAPFEPPAAAPPHDALRVSAQHAGKVLTERFARAGLLQTPVLLPGRSDADARGYAAAVVDPTFFLYLSGAAASEPAGVDGPRSSGGEDKGATSTATRKLCALLRVAASLLCVSNAQLAADAVSAAADGLSLRGDAAVDAAGAALRAMAPTMMLSPAWGLGAALPSAEQLAAGGGPAALSLLLHLADAAMTARGAAASLDSGWAVDAANDGSSGPTTDGSAADGGSLSLDGSDGGDSNGSSHDDCEGNGFGDDDDLIAGSEDEGDGSGTEDKAGGSMNEGLAAGQGAAGDDSGNDGGAGDGKRGGLRVRLLPPLPPPADPQSWRAEAARLAPRLEALDAALADAVAGRAGGTRWRAHLAAAGVGIAVLDAAGLAGGGVTAALTEISRSAAAEAQGVRLGEARLDAMARSAAAAAAVSGPLHAGDAAPEALLHDGGGAGGMGISGSGMGDLLRDMRDAQLRVYASGDEASRRSARVAELTRRVHSLGDRAEEVAEAVAMRNAALSGTAPLQALRSALTTLRAESRALDVRLGLLSYTVMQLRLDDERHVQARARQGGGGTQEGGEKVRGNASFKAS